MMENRLKRDVVILLVEDDPGDQELMRRSIDATSGSVKLHIVDDGEQAIDYLLRRGAFSEPSSSPRPDLVLLDLNLPKLEGREVLRTIRAMDEFRSLPIVVLSTSSRDEEVVRLYELGCNSYITKPLDIDHVSEMVRQLQDYWFGLVRLPRPELAKR